MCFQLSNYPKCKQILENFIVNVSQISHWSNNNNNDNYNNSRIIYFFYVKETLGFAPTKCRTCYLFQDGLE